MGEVDFLKKEERITLSLRGLYEQHGYRKYKMSRFEEYDLYLDNKNFLRTKHIITFNDLDGRVLALKPDVTLSIVKNTRATAESTEKIYYLENVYRLDPKSRSYREISQIGLECFGRLDVFGTGEVLRLAAATLAVIGENWMMTVSHTGFVLKLLEGLDIDLGARQELIECIRLKRVHEIRESAGRLGITPAVAQMLASIAELGGSFTETVKKARGIAIMHSMTEALNQLEAVYELLLRAGYGERIRLDFSLINDLDYYSGIVFQGFVQGVPRPVMAGGYYGALLKKFGRDLDAIGFAVYLNELNYYYRAGRRSDIDALVLYDDSADLGRLLEATEALIAEGLSVRTERSIPEELKYDKLFRFTDGALEEVIDHA